MENGRICTKCGVYKDYQYFYRCSKVKSGYKSRCKECSQKELNAYRQKNRELVRKKSVNITLKTKKCTLKSTRSIGKRTKKKYIKNQMNGIAKIKSV